MMKKPMRRRDLSQLSLSPIGWALAGCFAAAALGLVGLTWIGLALLHFPIPTRSRSISLHDLIGVLQLVFASVAGAGALVALVMAYRRQRVAEASSAHDRSRVLNERFTAITAQLGSDQATIRLAGVHAMAGLADDWEENRQTCIDVLCAYLRMPYELDPGDQAPEAEQLAFQASREVRHTVIRIIRNHLNGHTNISWRGCDFDFTNVIFDGATFFRVEFGSGGFVSFSGAQFRSGVVSFRNASFAGSEVTFTNAVFSGAQVIFDGAEFSDGKIWFSDSGFARGEISFSGTQFSGATVSFDSTDFSGGKVIFDDAVFSGGEVTFRRAEFSGSPVSFRAVAFKGSSVIFDLAEFSDSEVSFFSADFRGGHVDFRGADFSGGRVDLSVPHIWSTPPSFDAWTTRPIALYLPTANCAN